MKNLSLIICVIGILGLSSCASETPDQEQPANTIEQPTAEPAGAVEGTTLNPITCNEAHTKLNNYGKWVGEYLRAVTNSDSCFGVTQTPRFWDIKVEELNAVLSNCTGAPEDQVVRVYLSRSEFVNHSSKDTVKEADLILVPIRMDKNTPVEDLTKMHDLISPCPSTCQGAVSSFEHTFYEGVNEHCDVENLGEVQNPCGEGN